MDNITYKKEDFDFFYDKVDNLTAAYDVEEPEGSGNYKTAFSHLYPTAKEKIAVLNDFIFHADGDADCQDFPVMFCDRDDNPFALLTCKCVYKDFATIVLDFAKLAQVDIYGFYADYETGIFFVTFDLDEKYGIEVARVFRTPEVSFVDWRL